MNMKQKANSLSFDQRLRLVKYGQYMTDPVVTRHEVTMIIDPLGGADHRGAASGALYIMEDGRLTAKPGTDKYISVALVTVSFTEPFKYLERTKGNSGKTVMKQAAHVMFTPGYNDKSGRHISLWRTIGADNLKLEQTVVGMSVTGKVDLQTAEADAEGNLVLSLKVAEILPELGVVYDLGDGSKLYASNQTEDQETVHLWWRCPSEDLQPQVVEDKEDYFNSDLTFQFKGFEPNQKVAYTVIDDTMISVHPIIGD